MRPCVSSSGVTALSRYSLSIPSRAFSRKTGSWRAKKLVLGMLNCETMSDQSCVPEVFHRFHGGR